MTMPTPNRGQEAASLAMIRNAVDMLTKALSGLGAESEPGQAILTALKALSKHVPQGATTPGAQQAGMQQFMMEQRQKAPLLAALAAMRGGGAGPNAGGPPAIPPPAGGAGPGSPLTPGG